MFLRDAQSRNGVVEEKVVWKGKDLALRFPGLGCPLGEHMVAEEVGEKCGGCGVVGNRCGACDPECSAFNHCVGGAFEDEFCASASASLRMMRSRQYRSSSSIWVVSG